MAVIETWLHQDADSLVEVVPLKGNLFYGDDGGNLIGVEVTRAGAAVSLPSGCYGYGILSNGTTEYISGTVSGNRAYVILPKEWCACVGPISIVIKTGATMQAVPNEGTKPVGGVTLAACTGYVYKTRTDTIVDPGSALPDIGQLEAAIANCIAATTNAEKVNVSQSKSGNTITVTTTNRNGQSTNQTLTEPTVSVTKHGTTDPVPAREGDFDITVIGPNASGNIVTHTVTIPNPNAELSDRAHVNTVSRLKTRTGNPIKIEDAVNEIADKTVIKLVPKQDLHGYSRPWVGGAGKNKLDETSPMRGCYTQGGVFLTDGTYPQNYISYKLTLPAGTYTFSTDVADCFIVRYLISDIKTEVQRATQTVSFTLSAEAEVKFSLRNTSTSSIASVTPNSMIEVGSTATAFEPYANICPISGYDTVNTAVYKKNQIVKTEIGSINTTTGMDENVRTDMIRTGFIPVKTNTYYMFSIDAVTKPSNSVRMFRYDKNKNMVGTMVFTPNYMFSFVEGSAYVRFQHSELNYPLDTLKQFEEGSVATEIEPYGKTYPIAVSLATNGNQTAGTVYSGTVTLLADGSGQVKVDSAILTEQDFISIDSNVSTGGLHFTQLDNRGNPAAVAGICNMMGVDTTGAAWNSTIPVVQMATAGRIRVYGAFTTISEFKTQFAGLQIVYPLTNPLTFTLTANQVQTLLGYNYIYTDGTEIALTYRQESLATNETLLKLLPTGSAIGNPVTFSDGADGVPLKQLVVNVEPKQEGSGTPSPTNIRPIRGWDSVPLLQTGKNLIAITATSGTVSNVAVTVNNDGTVKLHGTANADGTITLASGIQTKGGEQYWLTGCPSEGVYNSTYWLNYFGVGVDEDGNDAYLMFNSSGSLSGGIAASEPDLTGTVSIKFKNGTVFNNVVFSPMLYNSSLSRDFEPGVKKTYSIALPSEAGTVYSGTLTLDENGEGNLVVDCGIKDIKGTESGYTGSKSANANGRGLIYTDLSGIKAAIDSVVMSDKAQIVSSHTDSGISGLCVSGRTSVAGYAISIELATIGLTSSATASQIVTALVNYISANNFQIVYKLANPVTYSLTADQVKTLLGTNIISSDAGNVEVEYFQKLSDKGTGEYSHVEGRSTIASGLASHAEGDATEATGASAHSEGYSTHATGNNSHAEGMNSTASGEDSHAEGFLTTASGDFSHAEGSTATASGQSSHAEGKGTIANHLAQHVFGIFNVADPSTAAATAKGNYVEIVGNGESVSAKHNARTLDWNGNEWLAGSLTLGNTTLTEAKLAELVSISSATGVTF